MHLQTRAALKIALCLGVAATVSVVWYQRTAVPFGPDPAKMIVYKAEHRPTMKDAAQSSKSRVKFPNGATIHGKDVSEELGRAASKRASIYIGGSRSDYLASLAELQLIPHSSLTDADPAADANWRTQLTSVADCPLNLDRAEFYLYATNGKRVGPDASLVGMAVNELVLAESRGPADLLPFINGGDVYEVRFAGKVRTIEGKLVDGWFSILFSLRPGTGVWQPVGTVIYRPSGQFVITPPA